MALYSFFWSPTHLEWTVLCKRTDLDPRLEANGAIHMNLVRYKSKKNLSTSKILVFGVLAQGQIFFSNTLKHFFSFSFFSFSLSFIGNFSSEEMLLIKLWWCFLSHEYRWMGNCLMQPKMYMYSAAPPIKLNKIIQIITIVIHQYKLNLPREATKKSSFISGPATKAFSPPPSAIGTFFLT